MKKNVSNQNFKITVWKWFKNRKIPKDSYFLLFLFSVYLRDDIILKIRKNKHLNSHGTKLSNILHYMIKDIQPFLTPFKRITSHKDIISGNPQSLWAQLIRSVQSHTRRQSGFDWIRKAENYIIYILNRLWYKPASWRPYQKSSEVRVKK